MKLILVRHGETTGNSALRYWGATDLALSGEGLAQVELLARRLKGETIDSAYCSGLARAIRTAEEITRGRSVDVIKCRELNELNFGRLEGLSAEEINAGYPEFYGRWLAWDTELEFPGGESVKDLKARVAGFTEKLKSNSQADTVLIVAHAGTLRMLICHLMELPLSYWRKTRLELASVSTLELTPRGAVLTGLNDTAHLIK